MDLLVASKINQVAEILGELELDLWLIFVRESMMQADPVMPLVVGHDVVWQSCFAYTRAGEAIALVGNLDAANFADGPFTEVLTYTQGVRHDIQALITRLNPRQIALNYSTDDVAADGLTLGMYNLLSQYLSGTPYPERFVSSQELVTRLRSRKLPEEISRVEIAARKADDIWREIVPSIKLGLSEKQVAELLDERTRENGAVNAFATIVNAGDKTEPGHGAPTDTRLEAGDLLHVDFGVRIDHYCSDIQRLVYLCRPGETEPPAELKEAFAMVRDIITESAAVCLPGVRGFEVDRLARERLRENGFPEYQHALGHQLGRSVHDGGGILGPKWERYGRMPEMPLEVGNVFTLELEINLPGIGCVGLEEDVCITDDGARFLSPRQMELAVV